MAIGDQIYPGAKTHRAGSPTGEVGLRFGATETEGLEKTIIDETLALDAVSNDLTVDIPDGVFLLSVQGNQETAGLAAGTTANVGIGTVANPDLYSPTVGDLAANSKIDHIPDPAVISGGAVDVQVHGVTAGGAIGDTAPGGTYRIRIVYYALASLDDA